VRSPEYLALRAFDSGWLRLPGETAMPRGHQGAQAAAQGAVKVVGRKKEETSWFGIRGDCLHLE
jgi:hypothetical protein